ALEADAAWRQRIADALAGELDADERPLLAARDVLATPADKRAAAAGGAAAVDLESGAIAAAACAANVPFVVVRAVADGPSDALPADVADWIDADGNPLVAPVVDAALRPRNW